MRLPEDPNLIVINRNNPNNNSEQIDNDFMKLVNDTENELPIYEMAKYLFDSLFLCTRLNSGIYLSKNYRNHEDIAVKTITKKFEFICNSPIIKTLLCEFPHLTLFSNYPRNIDNYIFNEFDLIDTEGNIIYYNAYAVCDHANHACNNCKTAAHKKAEAMKVFIKNLYC